MTKTRRKQNSGFTMAELLVVVAIIGILSGVAFIAVQQYQRRLAQLERDSIAREIFVAAQNHLAMAKSEDYLGLDSAPGTGSAFGAAGKATSAASDQGKDDVYYFYSGTGFSLGGDGSVLDYMLPFGSVDETVRSGQYIIRYQPKAGVVLDVFYWTKGDRFQCAALDGTSYADLMNNYANGKQKNYSSGVLGWYGGEDVVETGVQINAPYIEVVNAERLLVRGKNTNTTDDLNGTGLDASKVFLKIITTGMSSTAKAAIKVPLTLDGSTPAGRVRYDVTNHTFEVVLDDITKGGHSDSLHFANINKAGATEGFEYLKDASNSEIAFIPGEDILIQAVAYSNEALANVAYSGEWITNSLYAELRKDTETTGGGTAETKITALVSNIRHLENLDSSLSTVSNADHARFDRAEQTVDLDWTDFLSDIKTATGKPSVDIYQYNTAAAAATGDNFLPVTPGYTLSYSGQSAVETTGGTKQVTNHSISNIVVNTAGNAGVFGTLAAGSSVADLKLADIRVETTGGNAGTLAGAVTGTAADSTTITNVLAVNTRGASGGDAGFDNDTSTGKPANVTVTGSGSAGGLIGAISSDTASGCVVTKCAAAVYVRSESGNAGGLVGVIQSASGGAGGSASILASYAGGHTATVTSGSVDHVSAYSTGDFNVLGGAGKGVGGLVGDAGKAAIKYAYSTCSVSGGSDSYVGGLVGTLDSGGSAEYSYCTGLVSVASGVNEGAFAGSSSGTIENCYYLEIINERLDSTAGTYTWLDPVGNNASATGIRAIDADTDTDVDAGGNNLNTYNIFSGMQSAWKPAEPYNSDLLALYGGTGSTGTRPGKYNLETVSRLVGLAGADASVPVIEVVNAEASNPADYVATHYGDWPAPEVLIVNEKP